MAHRHPPLPRLWLMTDERMAEPVAATMRLPRGSGIVFRHHATPGHARRALFDAIHAVARRRGLTLLLAATPATALSWGASGAHHRSTLPSRGIRTVAVHNGRELGMAVRAKADLIFISPVFATRSHPGRHPLGPVRLGLLAGRMRSSTIALGGMNAMRFRRLAPLRIRGWAAVDALS